MRYGRNLGILVFFIAALVLLSTSLFITPLAVSDADPSTYVIVPTLMLPLFVLFSLKAAPDPRVGRGDIAIGSAMFAAFLLLSFSLRFSFSFFFVSFRIDLLLLPLALAALAVLLFGAEGLRRFRGLLLYALLASPPVLLFLLESYGTFTSLNTLIVYGLLKPFVSGISYVAPITISANGYYIGIGQACVSIGIFIALALFLVPIAYLYDGKDSSKARWAASGVILLFALNILRMLFVSYAWLSWEPSGVVALIHEFVGVLLFYAVIIVMVLATGKYGLTLLPKRRTGKARARKGGYGWWAAAMALALAFSLAYAYSTLYYAGALDVSPIALSNQIPFNFSNPEMARAVGGLLAGKGTAGFAMASENGAYALFSLTNVTTNEPAPIIVSVSREGIMKNIGDNATVRGPFRFLEDNGASEEVSDVLSNGTEFFLYRTEVPLVLDNMSSSIAEVYLIIPDDALGGAGCVPSYEGSYAAVLNALNAGSYNATEHENVLRALCISERIAWSS